MLLFVLILLIILVVTVQDLLLLFPIVIKIKKYGTHSAYPKEDVLSFR